jgi:hypothetical protein
MLYKHFQSVVKGGIRTASEHDRFGHDVFDVAYGSDVLEGRGKVRKKKG